MSTQQDTQQLHWHFTEFDDQNLEIKGRTVFLLATALVVVILVTLLFLYARWVCRYPNGHNNDSNLPAGSTTSSTDQSQQQQQQHHLQTRLSGLDVEAINGLPIILYQTYVDDIEKGGDSNRSNEECCICLSYFEDGDKVKILPKCSHCYHSDCVDRWLVSQSSCPLCRVSLLVVADSLALVPISHPIVVITQ